MAKMITVRYTSRIASVGGSIIFCFPVLYKEEVLLHQSAKWVNYYEGIKGRIKIRQKASKRVEKHT